MVNDDKPLIRVGEDGRAEVFGTPWNGKHHLGNNMSASVRAICFLERAEENSIVRISRSEALPELIRQTYRPSDPEALGMTLNLIGRMDAGFFRLGCNIDISTAEISYETMRRK